MVGIVRSLAVIILQVSTIVAQSTSITFPSQDVEAQRLQRAADAWVYGLPAYLIQRTRNNFINAGVPLNFVTDLLSLVPFRPDSFIRNPQGGVVLTAFFDLSQGPVTLHIPSVTDRYFVAGMFDAYGNNFANPGTFQNSPAGNYTLYGPADAFRAPPFGFNIVSQTNDVWMIARFYSYDVSVRGSPINQTTLLRTISQLVVTNAPAKITSDMPSFSPDSMASATPGELAMQAYYGLNQAVSDNPYQAAPYNQNFSTVGLAVGRSFRPTLSTTDLAVAQFIANASIARFPQQAGALQRLGNDWTRPLTIGSYGENFLARAYAADTALGSPTPDQGFYASYNGSTLTSAFGLRYTIHFPAGAPPVRQNGFWSLSLLGQDNLPAGNLIARYNLGTRDNITMATNGSFTIFASSQRPVGAGQMSNWLPAPVNQQWKPSLAIFGATDAVFSGAWTFPIIRVMT